MPPTTTTPPPSSGPSPAPSVSRSPLTLDDVVDGLLWPRLIRAGALALNPGRLWLASFLIVCVYALDTTWRGLFGGPVPGPLMNAISNLRRPGADLLNALLPHTEAGSWVWVPDLGRAGRAVFDLFILVPRDMVVSEHASVWQGIIATVVLLPPAILLTAVVGGAICRSVAIEFATGQQIPWTRALGFGLSRWGSLVGAVVGPLALIWTLCLVLMALGWFMKWPGLDVLGAILFPLILLLAVVAALVMAAYVVGHGMLIPAVAADGADGFDAIQRAYAYVYARPVRLVAYIGVLLVTGIVVVLLLGSFVSLTVEVTRFTTGVRGDAAPLQEAGWLARIAHWFISFWIAVLHVAVAAYAISFYFSGSMLLYLLMRRLADDQDIREIWMPQPDGGLATPGQAIPAVSSPAQTPDGPASRANPDPADYA